MKNEGVLDCLCGRRSRWITAAATLGMSIVPMLVGVTRPVLAGPTDGNGVLLFNYSSMTAYVSETSNPAPSCVNNQGSIPQPMIASPGTIGNPTGQNQDIEFTAQDGGGAAKCQVFYRGETLNVWQYPFSLYFSDGLPGITYVFGSNGGENSTADCVANALGNVVGLSQVAPCVYQKFGEPQPNNTWWEYQNNSVVTVYPSNASYYYTLTSLAGPAQGNPPSGVPNGVTGSGNACSAPNWNSCVLIQVYNVGQGPGSAALAEAASVATGGGMDRLRVPTSLLPVSDYPSIKEITAGFESDTAAVNLFVNAGRASPSLVHKYGVDHVVNRLNLLVMVTGAGGKGVYLKKSIDISATEPTTGIVIPLLFSRDDAHAIQQAFSNGRGVDIRAQVVQHIITPKRTFQFPVVKQTHYWRK